MNEKLFEIPEEPMPTTIANCPYCHNKAKLVGKVKKGTRGEHSNYYVRCITCNARSPLCSTTKQAIANWNKVPELIALLRNPF